MTRRQQKIRMIYRLAMDIRELSTCKRNKVGCVVFSKDFRHLCIGYNGPPSGLDDCVDEVGNCGCVHAEINALMKVTFDGPLYLYCTLSPCNTCAGSIINDGRVTTVMYREKYRCERGIDRMRQAGIKVFQI